MTSCGTCWWRSTPGPAANHDLTVVEAMDAARADVDSIFAEQPLVAAEMHATMGQTYLGLQKLTEAEEEVRKGLEMRTELLGPDHPDLADGWMSLSKIQRFNVQLDEAIEAGKEVVRIRALHFPPADPEMLVAYNNLAELYITDRKFAEADSVLDLMDGIIAESTTDLRPQTAAMLNLRARVAAESRDDLAAADSLYLESVAIAARKQPRFTPAADLPQQHRRQPDDHAGLRPGPRHLRRGAGIVRPDFRHGSSRVRGGPGKSGRDRVSPGGLRRMPGQSGAGQGYPGPEHGRGSSRR